MLWLVLENYSLKGKKLNSAAIDHVGNALAEIFLLIEYIFIDNTD